MASPCGRGGLWPPTIWYRFAYSLSPAIPSLPRNFALLQAFGVGLRHARGFASDRALAAAFSATCGINLEKYMFRLIVLELRNVFRAVAIRALLELLTKLKKLKHLF